MSETSTDTRADSVGPRFDLPLASGFLRASREFASRPALEVGGISLTYGELAARAHAIAAVLEERTPAGGPGLTAVFAYRTQVAFAGVLGALLSGCGYVPLNRRLPAARTRTMLLASEARAMIVDRESQEQLPEILADIDRKLLLVLPDELDAQSVQRRWPEHDVVCADGLARAPSALEPRPLGVDDVAYLLFTSGSTGTPKGVGVTHGNARAYLEAMTARWRPTETDRFSQTFDMTFDLSVTDMFLTWGAGACLCCPPAHVLSRPAKFIVESRLSVWYAVPSIGLLMRRFGMLNPGQYPGLRLVLSCGEPLTAELAAAWSAAAPNAVVENAYGPTEATISCSTYRWDRDSSPAECEQGVVPIGSLNPGLTAAFVDPNLREVEPGEVGELLVSGPQVVPGYWRDAEKTAAAFVRLPGANASFYRTGDLVRRPVGAAPMTYHGRVDHQVKISGHRVELGEIEAVLREVLGAPDVVVVAWPRTSAGYAGVIGFVAGDAVDEASVRAAMAKRLPDYMVPRQLLSLSALPLNPNGKVDRRALEELLAERGA